MLVLLIFFVRIWIKPTTEGKPPKAKPNGTIYLELPVIEFPARRIVLSQVSTGTDAGAEQSLTVFITLRHKSLPVFFWKCICDTTRNNHNLSNDAMFTKLGTSLKIKCATSKFREQQAEFCLCNWAFMSPPLQLQLLILLPRISSWRSRDPI